MRRVTDTRPLKGGIKEFCEVLNIFYFFVVV